MMRFRHCLISQTMEMSNKSYGYYGSFFRPVNVRRCDMGNYRKSKRREYYRPVDSSDTGGRSYYVTVYSSRTVMLLRSNGNWDYRQWLVLGRFL